MKKYELASFGMRKSRRKQLAECNSSKTTRRKHIADNWSKINSSKNNSVQTRRIITDYKQGLSSANCANYG